ncbi:MAG TPA: aldehyde dehydrogenase family protein [Actinocrinis sp.]|uniref:aldehyde dehydrogenase family protein n=1 Tax=Actinocrinis sp. TaxID=1920516 RepID=UPI002D4E633E|nr:aldehyde dehydrogenase family protein [Actinocrinis sp.]HZU56981.1 aldehyde dehydrogenase family protein [Actinocrinis sp.]
MPAIRTEITPPSGDLFINGAWTESAAHRDILDPSTGTVITAVAQAGPKETDAAIAAARRAFDEGPWRAMAPRERGRILLRAAEILRGRAEEFARLESLNTGKPITFSRVVDVATTIDQIEYYGALAAGIEGATRRTGAPAFAYTRREPLGVVAAITPFNFPLILSSIKIAPALAAGNTVIHKPAEETPLTALRIAEVLQEAGVPDGVFNVLPGDGEVGQALVRDPRVDKVAFTGSTAIGRSIAAEAAQTLKHVTVELGGKSANIVFADADIEKAIGTAIAGFVFNTGQFCMAGTRLLVQRPVYDDVLAALSGAIGHVPLGDPFDEATVIGPMTGPRHLAKVRGFLDRVGQTSAKPITADLPDLASDLSAGFWTAPTVLADVDQDSPFVQEEIFGPVLTVQPFDTEEEAIRLANGTAYGLAAGLQTTNIARAHRVAEQLRAGIVWVNGWALLDAAMPFGGVHQSGYGREGGPEGLDEYLQTKSVLVALD